MNSGVNVCLFKVEREVDLRDEHRFGQAASGTWSIVLHYVQNQQPLNARRRQEPRATAETQTKFLFQISRDTMLSAVRSCPALRIT